MIEIENTIELIAEIETNEADIEAEISNVGPQGPAGKTPKIKIGTVTTLEPGTEATASIRGTDEEPIIDFGIPRGTDGNVEFENLTEEQKNELKGAPGKTPSIQIGTVATLESNENATVTRSGTDEEPLLNFGIPKGEGLKYVYLESGVGTSTSKPIIFAERIPGIYLFPAQSGQITLYAKASLDCTSVNYREIHFRELIIIKNIVEAEEKECVGYCVDSGLDLCFVLKDSTLPSGIFFQSRTVTSPYAKRSGANITGTYTFSYYLPKCTEVPTDDAHLINKKYVDNLLVEVNSKLLDKVEQTDIDYLIADIVELNDSVRYLIYSDYEAKKTGRKIDDKEEWCKISNFTLGPNVETWYPICEIPKNAIRRRYFASVNVEGNSYDFPFCYPNKSTGTTQAITTYYNQETGILYAMFNYDYVANASGTVEIYYTESETVEIE